MPLYRFVGYNAEPVNAPTAFAAALALCEGFAERDDGTAVSVTRRPNRDFRIVWTRRVGFGMPPIRIRLDLTVAEEVCPPGATLDGKLRPLRAADAEGGAA